MQQDLEKLGLEAAQRVAGKTAIQKVAVEQTIDSLDQPAYNFTFLFDSTRSKHRLQPGKVYVRIIQALLDDLTRRGDDHRPMITLLDPKDWNRRQDARP